MVCTHVRLGILANILCVYVSIVVEGIYACKTGNYGNEPLLFLSVLLQRVCTHVRLETLKTSLCVDVSVVVEGMKLVNLLNSF